MRTIKNEVIPNKMQNEFYNQFCRNFFTFLKIATEKRYKKVCKKKGVKHYVMTVHTHKTGRLRNIHSLMAVALQVSVLSDLPVGTWLFGDVDYLYRNGIIVLGEDVSFNIAPMYMTDGVYFYSKHIDHAVPLGTKAEFQKMVDECFDLRVWKYKQPT